MYCGAKTRDGGSCRAPAMPNGRCRKHGGKSPAGLASATLTANGRHSKYLPVRLAARYQDAQAEGELVSVRDELALIDTRLSDLLTRVDTGEAGASWAAVGKAIAEFDRASESSAQDAPYRQALALQTIRDLATGAREDHAAWSEIAALVEQRRKLAETEAKRVNLDNQTISADRAMLLIGAILGVIREHVNDRDTLANISRGVGRLLDRDGGTGTRRSLPGE